jgi:hypothetical protein
MELGAQMGNLGWGEKEGIFTRNRYDGLSYKEGETLCLGKKRGD